MRHVAVTLIVAATSLGMMAGAQAQQTGYGVGINIPLANNNPIENPKQDPLVVVATCNGTTTSKDLEGWVGQNSPTTVQDMVASQSGTGRLSITIVVPWRWYYYLKVADASGGMPPGGSCKATAWWMY